MRSIRFTSFFVTVKVILNLQIHTKTGSVGCHRFTFFYDKARAQAKREHKKNFVGPLQPWQLAKPNKVNYPPDATKGEIFVINMGLVGRALRQEREEKEQAAREKAARGDQQGSG